MLVSIPQLHALRRVFNGVSSCALHALLRRIMAAISADDSDSYYAVLAVPRNATSSQIRAAKNRLALRVHPDKADTASAFLRIEAAYSVLSNELSRWAYDEYGSLGVSALNSIPHSYASILSENAMKQRITKLVELKKKMQKLQSKEGQSLTHVVFMVDTSPMFGYEQPSQLGLMPMTQLLAPATPFQPLQAGFRVTHAEEFPLTESKTLMIRGEMSQQNASLRPSLYMQYMHALSPWTSLSVWHTIYADARLNAGAAMDQKFSFGELNIRMWFDPNGDQNSSKGGSVSFGRQLSPSTYGSLMANLSPGSVTMTTQMKHTLNRKTRLEGGLELDSTSTTISARLERKLTRRTGLYYKVSYTIWKDGLLNEGPGLSVMTGMDQRISRLTRVGIGLQYGPHGLQTVLTLRSFGFAVTIPMMLAPQWDYKAALVGAVAPLSALWSVWYFRNKWKSWNQQRERRKLLSECTSLGRKMIEARWAAEQWQVEHRAAAARASRAARKHGLEILKATYKLEGERQKGSPFTKPLDATVSLQCLLDGTGKLAHAGPLYLIPGLCDLSELDDDRAELVVHFRYKQSNFMVVIEEGQPLRLPLPESDSHAATAQRTKKSKDGQKGKEDDDFDPSDEDDDLF
eukprot:g81657.t1